jgi:hypothetical protein
MKPVVFPISDAQSQYLAKIWGTEFFKQKQSVLWIRIAWTSFMKAMG